jgi:hypothetical protein
MVGLLAVAGVLSVVVGAHQPLVGAVFARGLNGAGEIDWP